MQKILIPALIGMLLTAAITVYGGYFTLKAKTEAAEKKIDDVKAEAKENVEKLAEETKTDINGLENETGKAKDKIVENEKIDLEQTILIKQISETLQKLNTKIDKEL